MRKKLYIGGAVVVLILVVLAFMRAPADDRAVTRPFSVLLAHMDVGSVERIEIAEDTLDVMLVDGTAYETQKERGVSLFTIFADNDIDSTGVEISVVDPDSGLEDWVGLIINFVPLFIFIGLIYALIRAVNRISRQ